MNKLRRRRAAILSTVGVIAILYRTLHHFFLLPSTVDNLVPSVYQQTNTATSIHTNATPSIYFDALDVANHTGYIADPYLLKQTLLKGDSSSACPSVCALRAGQGLEDDGGWKLLTEQIRVASHPINNVRILCAVYTHAGQHDMIEAIARTWGNQCDGFLAFSTETHPELGILYLIHEGAEAYGNMWQKVRSIWGYVYQHYRNDFDFFHLCGDDTYLIVPNLRFFLEDHISTLRPLHFGQWIPHGNTVFTGGGPGYTLNRAALALFVEQARACHASTVASYEDRLMSMCLQQLGVHPSDTRDANLQQLYHDVSPHSLYLATSKGRSFHSRAAAFWENKFNTSFSKLQNAGPYSVAFHDLFAPCYIQRVHAILYPHTCPSDSELAQELRRL
jgi:hypothetical protein